MKLSIEDLNDFGRARLEDDYQATKRRDAMTCSGACRERRRYRKHLTDNRNADKQLRVREATR